MQVFAELCPVLGLRVGLAAAQASVGTEAATLFPDATHNRQSAHGDISSHRCILVNVQHVPAVLLFASIGGDHWLSVQE